MHRLSRVAAVLLMAPMVALAQERRPTELSGTISTGFQQVNNDTDSSKFTEFRDIRNDLQVFRLSLDLLSPDSGRFLQISAADLTRNDQHLQLRAGRFGVFRFDADWNEVPQNLSNRAQSPFIRRGPGLFEVPATSPTPLRRLATAAADAPLVLASDAVTADFASRFVAPTDLRTQRARGTFGFRYSPLERLNVDIGYRNERQTGSRITYGPIGDRPPRTLNVQFAAPRDHRTEDVTIEAQHTGSRYVVQGSYLFSDFSNRIDTLVWENVYTAAVSDAEFDLWDRAISTFGRRALEPDNQYHNVSVSVAGDLPGESRLSATAAYGRLQQDEVLLPYSFHSTFLANPTLPRARADARMNTVQLNADYAVNPLPRLNVRAFYRYYDLANRTPESNWQYVTQDTSNLNGTVSFKNKRVNLAYAFDRQNAGVEATYRLRGWRSSVRLGYEREQIGRDFREAATGEDMLHAVFRARPAPRTSVRARYLYGNRDGGVYDPFVTRQSYWYTPAEAGTDQDNPQFTFSNHPDMRRFDVSDRRRHQLDLGASFSPLDTVTVSASVRYRTAEYDSGVGPVQPLLGTGLPDALASTPGDQLGLLEDERRDYTVDAFYAPHDRVTLNAFVSRQTVASLQRGLEFQENNKQNPNTVATAELGPWTRATSQWTADSDDRITSVGLGTTCALVPDRLSLTGGYTLAAGRVDIAYAGFGVVNWDGRPFPDDHQFGFRTPPAIRHDFHIVDLRLDYTLAGGVIMGVGYTFDRYRLRDWQQETDTPWVESAGTGFLTRDTSRSHQWGNRLVNMGSPLAPSYNAHFGHVTITYRF
jgi:MtrB/PioB family decaheme-associated outer membrane protein